MPHRDEFGIPRSGLLSRAEPTLDILVVPIDGGSTYTMSLDGISEITRRLRAPVVLPMHRFERWRISCSGSTGSSRSTAGPSAAFTSRARYCRGVSREALDRFAEPVIGRAFARPRWLAMTTELFGIQIGNTKSVSSRTSERMRTAIRGP